MKFKKKTISLALAAVMALGTAALFAGCGKDDEGNNENNNNNNGGGGTVTPPTTVTGTFEYEGELLSQMENEHDYNSNLFYVNTLDFAIADPTAVYVTKGKDKGYFYVYGTSDDIGGHGFQAWRSKDLARWECTGVAYQPDYSVGWAVNNHWAPEIIYDEEQDLYYLFYNADNIKDGNRKCLSVVVSNTPDGPFEAPTIDFNGKPIPESKPVFDVSINNPVLRELDAAKGGNFVKSHAIDASPFVDPVTKKKYLFFSYYNDYGEGSMLYGLEMKDWLTPDYTTLTKLTQPGYSTLDQVATGITDRQESTVNEGAFMVYRNGKYYLTFSVYGFEDPEYRVIQAVSDSPLGKFTKVDVNKGGKLLSTDTVNWTHIVSAGHHCFINAGDETFIAYHTFKDRNSIKGGRALAVDRIEWTENQDGLEVMHANGPTWSVQPLPAAISGYKNIAPSATVTANNTAEGSDVGLLTDGLVKYQEFDLAEEYEAKTGTSEITLSWSGYKTVRALMVYNSWDYEWTFNNITKVEMTYLKADGTEGVVTIDRLAYDWDWFFESDYEFVRPGGAAVAEFAELPVKTIKLTVRSVDGSDGVAIGEIVVLGKDTACAGISEFKPYSYTNSAVGSAQIVRESDSFGNVLVDGKECNLKTTWAYDLSGDDGTEDRYVEERGVGDQYAYFKDIYSTDFYIEATFNVTESKPYPAHIIDKLYPDGDPYPKFGLAVSCDDNSRTNTIFYYVDAVGFTSTRVGCAQRTMDNSDWDWNSTEKNREVAGIKYTGKNTVKLAIIRQGKQFYLLCNNVVAIAHDSFNVFTEAQRAGVGFLSFNTPLKVTQYYATADPAIVAQKIQQYV